MSGSNSPTLDIVAPGYGIRTYGFLRMRFPEIRQTIVESLQSRTGLIFETRPDSITGQFIDTFAERETAIWELCEAVYHAMYPIASFGTNLDHSVSFAGVIRLMEKKSLVVAILYGTEGAIVSAGAVVQEETYRNAFMLQEDVMITTMATVDVTFSIDTVVAGDTFTVSIDGILYSYTAIIGEDIFTATRELAIVLTAAPVRVITDANTIRLAVLELLPFEVILTGNMTFVIIGSGGKFVAEIPGPIEVLRNTLNVIITTQTGWDSVNNIVESMTGRNDETDDELRLRYEHGVFRLGAATMESIDANLRQNVPGLIYLKVYENVDDVVDADGRVPHCIEIVAWGGDSQLIATEIYLLKAAGIDTHGDQMYLVTDSNGFDHPIYFNRPTHVFIWVNVNVTLYDEETFPSDGDVQIERIIVATGNTFGIDKDVIVQRFHGPIYSTVRGIQILDITIAMAPPGGVPPPGAYSNVTIPVGPRELSRFDQSRITVNIL